MIKIEIFYKKSNYFFHQYFFNIMRLSKQQQRTLIEEGKQKIDELTLLKKEFQHLWYTPRVNKTKEIKERIKEIREEGFQVYTRMKWIDDVLCGRIKVKDEENTSRTAYDGYRQHILSPEYEFFKKLEEESRRDEVVGLFESFMREF